MAIGVRVSATIGFSIGPAIGVSPGQLIGGDGPSGTIRVPMTANSFLSITGRNASHAYTCQETSGSLIDQIGTMNLTPGVGAPTYRVSITGWSRKGVGFSRVNNQGFTVGAGVGPNPTVTPVAMLIYYTSRNVIGLNELLMITDGGINAWAAVFDSGATGGVLSTFCGAATNAGTATHQDGAVHPLLFTYDPAGSINRYTDLERDDGTFAAGVVDGAKGIGADGTQASHNGEILAYWIMQGADAQFTAAQAKALLQALGWAPGWS